MDRHAKKAGHFCRRFSGPTEQQESRAQGMRKNPVRGFILRVARCLCSDDAIMPPNFVSFYDIYYQSMTFTIIYYQRFKGIIKKTAHFFK